MMKSFMTSESPPQSMEAKEAPNEGDTVHFPREDMVMMIYGGCPSPGMRCASNPSLGTLAHCV
jgi:hypothetical protein